MLTHSVQVCVLSSVEVCPEGSINLGLTEFADVLWLHNLHQDCEQMEYGTYWYVMHALLFHDPFIFVSQAGPNFPLYCTEPVVISDLEMLHDVLS